MPDSVAIRKTLAEKNLMGCPKTLNYRLDSPGHIKSAIAYYGHKDTVKCKGFWKRTCAAAKRIELNTPKIQEKCK